MRHAAFFCLILSLVSCSFLRAEDRVATGVGNLTVSPPRGYGVYGAGTDILLVSGKGEGYLRFFTTTEDPKTVISTDYPGYYDMGEGEATRLGELEGALYTLRRPELSDYGMLVFIQDAQNEKAEGETRVVMVAKWSGSYHRRVLTKAVKEIKDLAIAPKARPAKELFEDAARRARLVRSVGTPGAERPQNYPTLDTCPACGGKGWVEVKSKSRGIGTLTGKLVCAGGEWTTEKAKASWSVKALAADICSTCDGQGKTPYRSLTVVCPSCKGKEPEDDDDECKRCKGSGEVKKSAPMRAPSRPITAPVDKRLLALLGQEASEQPAETTTADKAETPTETTETPAPTAEGALALDDIKDWSALCKLLNKGRSKTDTPAGRVMKYLPTRERGIIFDITIQGAGYIKDHHKTALLKAFNDVLKRADLFDGITLPKRAEQAKGDMRKVFLETFQ